MIQLQVWKLSTQYRNDEGGSLIVFKWVNKQIIYVLCAFFLVAANQGKSSFPLYRNSGH